MTDPARVLSFKKLDRSFFAIPISLGCINSNRERCSKTSWMVVWSRSVAILIFRTEDGIWTNSKESSESNDQKHELCIVICVCLFSRTFINFQGEQEKSRSRQGFTFFVCKSVSSVYGYPAWERKKRDVLGSEERRRRRKREKRRKRCCEPNRKCQVLFALVVYHAAVKGHDVDINSYM